MEPELAAIASLLPVVDLVDYQATRRAMADIAAGSDDARLQPWREPVAISDQMIPGPADSPKVPIRIYRPRGGGIRPGLVYYHGGAFVLGEIKVFDSVCAGYATNADLVVVSVDYRLAPENPFPAGPEDCYAALEWTVANAETLGIDPTSVAVGGSSAGGALSAAVALMARDRHGPALALQLLLNPVLDDRLDTVSVQTFRETPLWTSNDVAVMWDL